jgi:hypothetical protein
MPVGALVGQARHGRRSVIVAAALTLGPTWAALYLVALIVGVDVDSGRGGLRPVVLACPMWLCRRFGFRVVSVETSSGDGSDTRVFLVRHPAGVGVPINELPAARWRMQRLPYRHG